MRRRFRWLRPGSAVTILVAELLLLAVATCLVYLVVMWMGNGIEVRDSVN